MSDLPGTPRRDIDPGVIQDQIEKLTIQVARLMESREVPESKPEPASEHPKCFIVMPFACRHPVPLVDTHGSARGWTAQPGYFHYHRWAECVAECPWSRFGGLRETG